MKDPLGEMGYDTIFVIKGYNLNQLEMYENMAKLKNGTVKKNCNSTLQVRWHRGRRLWTISFL